MFKFLTGIFIGLLLAISFSGCVDPYVPELKGYESILVVEGLITDDNSSYTVKLSRSVQDQDTVPEVISDAVIYISDESAKNFYLTNFGNGLYKTDSTEFRGMIGNTYVLHIQTAEGNFYESEPYKMEAVSDIDNIYYARDQELGSNGTVMNEGLRIFLDSRGGINKYYRWDYEETWKFKVPSPKKYDYVNETIFVPVADVKEYCYKMRKSQEILIYSTFEGKSDRVEGQNISFIDPKKSDRLLIQYSVLMKQYSISEKEYDFWYNMKQINEKGGSIYSIQPFPVISNIHNVNDPDERVLGYFQVSAVKEKRKFITFSDLSGMNFPIYRNPCKRVEMAPKDYPRSLYSPPLTWDDLYEMYSTSGYYFVEPFFKAGTEVLDKMVFAKPECANCEFTGTITKPDFWIDFN
ncbi:MAG: DUF4249 domain-containing protein [Bacteroidales bacterium]|nr:DUF4249 domain-containing protein [Bacteroidales bacterium]